jgi:hypothetical protein
MEVRHFMAVVLTISYGVPSSAHALIALALADPLDVSGEVQAGFHLGHLVK